LAICFLLIVWRRIAMAISSSHARLPKGHENQANKSGLCENVLGIHSANRAFAGLRPPVSTV
jgi:hypothetical protein